MICIEAALVSMQIKGSLLPVPAGEKILPLNHAPKLSFS